MDPLNVCVAGATGRTGEAVARAVLDSADLRLRTAVARSAAGADLGVVWGGPDLGVPVFSTVDDALDDVDVLIDYTSHTAVGRHVRTAVMRGVHVVVGSSGLSGADYEEIAALAEERGVGVVAAANFSLTAAVAQAAARLATRYLPHWEIIDYASATEPGAPSGTARELAELMGSVHRPEYAVDPEHTAGHPQARGASIAGTQVHSLRLPGYQLAVEAQFGLPDERLVIRHEAGASPVPYVAGTLLAARAALAHRGLLRGLDALLLGGD
ncbi:4-hydroxy-tetrahydrodipicolinate reductase [Actinacidiphila sp. bgisy167]|uniref:4-hydroxy-tetrahydrodipicolinate reductase n=1 Tax=Actinacidiphila sp. bgisy167 TaxID=3413797 RepID=UPI003D7609C1